MSPSYFHLPRLRYILNTFEGFIHDISLYFQLINLEPRKRVRLNVKCNVETWRGGRIRGANLASIMNSCSVVGLDKRADKGSSESRGTFGGCQGGYFPSQYLRAVNADIGDTHITPTWVCGSNSQVPPPTLPCSDTSSRFTPAVNPFVWIPIGLLSPVAVALTDVALEPRLIEILTSSSARFSVRETNVSEKRPIQNRNQYTGIIHPWKRIPPLSSTDIPAFSKNGTGILDPDIAWYSKSLKRPSGGTKDRTWSRSHLLYLAIS